ncbi:MAG TPA: aminotransferase class I/II-fold pyridoxal phosphate-dependent enzyme [Candidatus Cybelea sp.]|jgi:aspartate/methionine/tyrosine aminotransferase
MKAHALRPFALERFFARYEFTTRYLLCSSDPESMPISELLALEPGADRRLAELRLGYIDSRGTPELRNAIASLYENRGAEQILAHSGTQEPIFAFMHAILEPGDHLVVQFPAYQSHYSIAESLGAHVTRWDADLDLGGAPDVGELERLVRPKTRAIVITTPNNPTGYQFTRRALDAIVEIARKRGIWLLGDEVYRGTEREAERLPAAADLYERGVSLGGTAKAYGLAGLRIGWAAAQDVSLLDEMASIKDYLTICNSAPSELLAALALRHAGELWERVARITSRNLDLLDGFFARRADRFRWTRPLAGTTAFPRYLAGSSEAFCTRLVERAGVLLLPSTAFDAGDAHCRLGYGRVNLPEALAALDEFMNLDG